MKIRENARALARFAAVQAVLQARQRGLSLARALHEASQQPWDGRFYSPETLETWVYKFQHGHFAALHDQPRSDQGQKRALDPAVTEALIQPGTFSYSTLHRRLVEAGLDRRSVRAGAGQLAGGPTKAFELPLPNLLWMADCMHGPVLKRANGPASLRTFLFALLDDHSRLCTHGQFYPAEKLECFLDCLRRTVAARGVPWKLYTDNGAAFRSQHLQIVCANLGIKLLHARPYHSWSRGKIERFFLTLQTQFLPQLTFQPVADLNELNTHFWRWLEADYHRHPHSALQNHTPAERFAKIGAHLRTVPPDCELERLFFMRLKRRVRKDATVSLHGALWEVPPHLRSQVVVVHFDPVQWTRVEIWFRDQFVALARPCNKHLNAQIRSSNDYQRFEH